jgi:hypothetical protein
MRSAPPSWGRQSSRPGNTGETALVKKVNSFFADCPRDGTDSAQPVLFPGAPRTGVPFVKKRINLLFLLIAHKTDAM